MSTEDVRAELAKVRALLSWIEGACVDQLPHREIQAAIERYVAGEDERDGI